MNTQRLIQCLLFGGLALFWVGNAAAEDAPFTIQVPVDLRDMHPDIQGGNISCQVLDAQDTPMAGGTVQFSIDRNTRSFNRTVPVSARLADGRSPQDARSYQCMLSLLDRESESGRPLRPGTPGVQGNPKFEAAPGAPFTPVVSGPISSSLPRALAPKKPIINDNIRIK